MATATRDGTQMWQTAIGRFYSELQKSGLKKQTIDKHLWNIKSPLELLEQVTDLESIDPKAPRLEPVLLRLDDIATKASRIFGMNGRVGAVIWGSIRMILKIGRPILPELLDMLEQLRASLPRFGAYDEKGLQMSAAFEKLLCDLYIEIIDFCAFGINFFRNNPNINKSRQSWAEFSSDFQKITTRIKELSDHIDWEAGLILMATEGGSKETLDMTRSVGKMSLEENMAKIPCHLIPYGLNLRFFSRSTEVLQLKEALEEGPVAESLRVIAIYGMGGVGKTQLALHYANTSLATYEVVAWIPSETTTKIVHALTELARKLGLDYDQSKGDDYEISSKIQNWLNSSKRRFLLIFDSVDDIDAIHQVWPSEVRGSIIITTRSPAVASKRAARTLHLQPLSETSALDALFSLTGTKAADQDQDDVSAAKEICHLLGGLPLALVQMSDLIRDRGYSFTEFLRIFQKSSSRVRAKGEIPLEYEHTLNTVWDLSLEKLPQSGRTLLDLLAFFDPDNTEEQILTNSDVDLGTLELDFLRDEFDFDDAVSSLTRASFVTRSIARKSLSVHRLVQATVFSRLEHKRRAFLVGAAIELVSRSFSDNWRKTGHQQGHGWADWINTGKALPHIGILKELITRENLKPSNMETTAELMFRAGTYLWEKEQPTLAEDFLTVGLSLGFDRQSELCNPAVRMLGHIALDKAQPRAALSAYNECLEARVKLVGPDVPAIADVLDSIACSYTELGDTQSSFYTLAQAIRIHEAHNPKHMARTQFILAVNCLRAEQPEDALNALRMCWELQGLNQEQISQSRYPKHSGDLVLLSRIHLQLGNHEEALQLASRTITIRKDILGGNGPRVADSMYMVANILQSSGKNELASRLLRETVEMGQGKVEMQGHVARACWVLASMEEGFGNVATAEALKAKARETRRGIQGRESSDEDTHASFTKLVPWLLL